jgi:hypothetical protein
MAIIFKQIKESKSQIIRHMFNLYIYIYVKKICDHIIEIEIRKFVIEIIKVDL